MTAASVSGLQAGTCQLLKAISMLRSAMQFKAGMLLSLVPGRLPFHLSVAEH